MAAAVLVLGFTAAVQAQGNGGGTSGMSKSPTGAGMPENSTQSGNAQGNNSMSPHKSMMHKKHHNKT
jgi:hypothetical protein